MADKQNATGKFMKTTGRLRMFFGPADRSSTLGEMTPEQKRSQFAAQESASQWEEVVSASGQRYLVEKKSTL